MLAKTGIYARLVSELSLHSACQDFGLAGKLDHKPTGQVSEEEIEYCRQDVRATGELLNAMRTEFNRHPIDLLPEHAYSPASIAKAYFKAMGVIAPMEKFNVPPDALGCAMQAYYGGRAEARIRHTAVPNLYLDFMSEYGTVNTLLELWPLFIAKDLRIEGATDEVRNLLASISPDKVFSQELWKQFRFFGLVEPDGDVLPVRTPYNGIVSNIGVKHLTHEGCSHPGSRHVGQEIILDRRIIQALRHSCALASLRPSKRVG